MNNIKIYPLEQNASSRSQRILPFLILSWISSDTIYFVLMAMYIKLKGIFAISIEEAIVKNKNVNIAIIYVCRICFSIILSDIIFFLVQTFWANFCNRKRPKHVKNFVGRILYTLTFVSTCEQLLQRMRCKFRKLIYVAFHGKVWNCSPANSFDRSRTFDFRYI